MLRLPFERLRTMGLLRGSGFPIAIDFGVSGLKALQLAPGDPPSLLSAAYIPTPEDCAADHAKRLEFQCKVLPELLKSGNFKGKRAVFAIPAAQTFCKHMQFARTEGVPISSLVKSVVSAQLNCHPDALVYRQIEVDGASGAAGGAAKAEVICLAAARDLITRLMNALRAAGLETVGIHPECVATVRAFEGINRRDADQHVATLYLDVGAGSTKVCIAHGKQLVFAKTIHLAGRHLDQAVAAKRSCDLETARRVRLETAELVPPARPARGVGARAGEHSHNEQDEGSGLALLSAGMRREGLTTDEDAAESEQSSVGSAAALESDRRESKIPPGLTPELTEGTDDDPAAHDVDLTEPLEALTDEIAMCLRYHGALFPAQRVSRLIFVGGESRHRGLCRQIARTLRLPAQVADPVARIARTGDEPAVNVDLDTAQPGWIVPFGLCLLPTDL